MSTVMHESISHEKLDQLSDDSSGDPSLIPVSGLGGIRMSPQLKRMQTLPDLVRYYPLFHYYPIICS